MAESQRGYKTVKMNNNLFNRKYLKKYRKELRNNPTKAESYLWKALKRNQLDGRKFRRQHSIGNYIVDFYCTSENLVIELDGEVHRNPINEEYDFKRSEFIKSKDLNILRFENNEVFENLDMVLATIRECFM
jgi:very-short-patch-repair endonuclease